VSSIQNVSGAGKAWVVRVVLLQDDVQQCLVK
jgi:hypothetical protein